MTILSVMIGAILAVPAWWVWRFTQARWLAQRSIPRTGEVWTQDGAPLYIMKVERGGLRLRVGGTGQQDAWTENWEVWSMRVRNRAVLRTEIRWPLEE